MLVLQAWQFLKIVELLELRLDQWVPEVRKLQQKLQAEAMKVIRRSSDISPDHYAYIHEEKTIAMPEQIDGGEILIIIQELETEKERLITAISVCFDALENDLMQYEIIEHTNLINKLRQKIVI